MTIENDEQYAATRALRVGLMNGLKGLELERASHLGLVRDLTVQLTDYERRTGRELELEWVDEQGASRRLLLPTPVWGQVAGFLAGIGLRLVPIPGTENEQTGPVYTVTKHG